MKRADARARAMADPWPRDVTPIDDEVVKLLGNDRALVLYLAALDGGVRIEDLVRVTGRPRQQAEHTASQLVRAGLLRFEGGVFRPVTRHLREADIDDPSHGPLRRAFVDLAKAAVDETDQVLRKRRGDARAGGGFVTIPDTTEALAKMTGILAQAEDQLRALQDEHPPGSAPRQVRVLIFVGSTSEPPART